MMTIHDIALTLEKGVGIKTAAKLITEFGSAEAIYNTPPHELMRRAEIPERLAQQIARKEAHHAAAREAQYVEKHELEAIVSTDPQFPAPVREMNDFPHVLYVRGNTGAMSKNCVSMVGTRQISTYGQTMCDRIVRQLAERVPDLCIVSGLAFGVDTHCHRAALRYGVPTVAVVANALPEITPTQHSDLAREIVTQGGAIVSELHSNSKQTGDFYLARNRIIAGLSEGTVIVEAPMESGAMATADLAYGYNRIVMAVPGRATDSTSFGTNMLIKSQKATMTTSGEDIVRALGWNFSMELMHASRASAGASGLLGSSGGSSGSFGGSALGISADAKGLLSCFVGGNDVSVDELMAITALEYNHLAPLLLELEFAGHIRRNPGGTYRKIS